MAAPSLRHSSIAAIGAFALVALTGCSFGSAPAETTAPPLAEVTSSPAGTGTCADVQTELDAIGTSVDDIASQVPGDIPGAIATLGTIVNSLATLEQSVSDPQLKSHVDALLTKANELQTIAGELVSGEGGLSAAGQILTKLGEVESAYNSLTAYCELQPTSTP